MNRYRTDTDTSDEDADLEPSRSGVFNQSWRDRHSRRTVTSESTAETGNAEVEILMNGETTAECWNKCQKYTDHGDFTAASDFTVSHLPLDYRDDRMHRCIKLMSDLTVRLTIRGTDSSSHIAGSSHEDIDTPRVTRMCTGFFSYFDINVWASMFENNPVRIQRSTSDYNAQTANSEGFSDSHVEFDLDVIKQRIVSKMNSEELKEFVRHFCCARLRHLCLLVSPAVESFNDKGTYFFELLKDFITICYENRSDELDVTELPLQDIIDDMAISRAMFIDGGVRYRNPACTSGDAATNILDDTTPKIPGDPTTNISGDSPTNVTDDATTNITDDPAASILNKTTSNISDDETTNISDEATTNMPDDATNNISGDATTNISGDSLTNISDDATTNISYDATTNMPDDATNNISDNATTNISGDSPTNISDDATTNISDDTTTNISGDSTINIIDDAAAIIADDTTSNTSDDTRSNISDDTTSNISGDSLTYMSDDSTTTNVHNSPMSSSDVKEELNRVYPCPCPECKSIPNPQPEGYVFDVLTDRRAVPDDEEAANTVVDLEFGGELKHLYGQTVHRVSAFCDLQCLRCVTHELQLAEWIKDTSAAFREICRQVRTKLLRPLAVICSYPHGHEKMVSVGEWIARFSRDCGSTAPLTYVSYKYTTPTCPGSMGAPVLILGKMESYRLVFSEMQSHYGNLPLDGNTSGVGLALAYDT